ncbi:MAG: ATP synthase F1 subunit gamma [Planctomycetia bacterium]|nr:ATP synthase F1 subunit gamma [Planctomycetia bacterium]MCC7315832.1 ATP synthase F1 subunit gamma [Planctomycetota bacterium]
MAKARQIVKRRKAVTNIRKITKTMQLIATARYQQAYQRATATKPYTQKITKLVEELSAAAAGQVDHPLLKENPDAPKDVLLVLTSNRGLCGGYNAGVVRKALAHLDVETDKQNELHVVGKKGIAYFKFIKRPLSQAITTIDDRPRFDQVEPLAAEFMRRFEAGEIRSVNVAYMRFISTGRQVPEVMRLLPLSSDTVVAADATAAPAGPEVQYEFSPEPKELLKVLLPQTVKVRLYQCFTDMAVSEQVARMVAMKAATDAAGDMIKNLSRQFNRARQSQITMELLDIVGCAEALK